MMIWIDGKPVPTSSGKTLLAEAWFIRQNLRPDSKIMYMNLEGGDSASPTYESLKAFAEMVLGPFTPASKRATYSPVPIRSVCAKMAGYRLRSLK